MIQCLELLKTHKEEIKYMRAADRFNQIYHTDPQYHTFTPYRICPMGAHSDHQYGQIL